METSGGAAFGFRITGSGEIRRTYQLLTSLRLNPCVFMHCSVLRFRLVEKRRHKNAHLSVYFIALYLFVSVDLNYNHIFLPSLVALAYTKLYSFIYILKTFREFVHISFT